MTEQGIFSAARSAAGLPLTVEVAGFVASGSRRRFFSMTIHRKNAGEMPTLQH
jgi:hypothetical protein